MSGSASATIRHVGSDLVERIERAAAAELRALLIEADTARAAPLASLDPVESVIAWDLAAGF
ncbi:hypothetical protein CMZ84_14640 [Lysobacteraceae bacterium NML93-0399]|nr:hypothetical protein CMZ84_14640 [Xanthomonadaceae bacterium NML93-0399]